MGPRNREALVAEGLASLDEAMRFLSIGRSMIYVLMDSGLLPYAKIGRCRRIPHRALVDLASRNLRGGDALSAIQGTNT